VKFKTLHASTGKVSTVGHFLRNSKLDDSSQLWNLLIGDMRSVGPWPYLSVCYDTLEGENFMILNLKPGITSLVSI
jgi:lipopolysaccharide/colanic/teichoic acid biosynthesis glycosyltransferase